jgi:hypothetical protein
MKILSTTSQWKQAVSEWRGIGDAPAKSNRPYRFGFKVLENDFLEKYVATAHWTLPGLWAIPSVIYLLYRSANTVGHERAGIAWLFLAGILGWTFVEYWLHRWVFHAAPNRNKVLRNVQFMLHGYHHEFPDDPGRLWPTSDGSAYFRDSYLTGHSLFPLGLARYSCRHLLRLPVLRLGALLYAPRAPSKCAG